MPRPLSKLEDQAYKVLVAKEQQYVMAVQHSLADALTTMRGQMAALYNKYAVEGKLTLAEMTKYNRYATMEKQMLATLDPAIKDNLKTIKKLTPDMYDSAFFHEAWAIDQATGLRTAWGIVNPKTVMENLANPFEKISLQRYGPESRIAIRSALNKGLPMGKSYDDMARDLKHALNTTNYKALRIIRTEGQTAMNAGQADAYLRAQHEGIQGDTIWDATLDRRTRPTHANMDGAKKQPDGLYNGPGSERAPYPAYWGLSAGERIHCRCRERFQIEGYSPALRRTREQGVLPYQKYDDWKKGRNAKWPRTKVKTEAEIMAEFGSGLTRLSGLGGSTGAWLAEDVVGKRWAVKQYLNATSPANSVANEYIASQIYRQLGLDVPFSRLATINGQPAFVTEMIAGGRELGTQEVKAYLQKKVRKGFVTDAFLANWDAIGMNADNILMTGVGSNAHMHRIDLGGSLLFRAQGTPKGSAFGKTVGELDSLISKNPQGAKWYGDVSKKELVQQINELQNNLDLVEIKAIIGATQMDEALKAELFSTLTERYVYLDDVRLRLIKEIKAEQKVARAAKKVGTATGDWYPPAPGVSVYTDMDALSPSDIHEAGIKAHMKKMNNDEQKALGAFGRGGSSSMNADARAGNPSPSMQRAIEKLPRMEGNLTRTMYPLDRQKFDMEWKNWVSGDWDTVEWKGFTSTSFGDIGWSGNTTFVVVNNTGKNLNAGLYGVGNAAHSFEKEVIINNGARFRVLGYSETKSGGRHLLLEPLDPSIADGSQPPPMRYGDGDIKEIFAGKRKIGDTSISVPHGDLIKTLGPAKLEYISGADWWVLSHKEYGLVGKYVSQNEAEAALLKYANMKA